MNRIYEAGLATLPTAGFAIAGNQSDALLDARRIHLPYAAIAETHVHGLMEATKLIGTVGGAAVGFVMGVSSVYFMRQAERRQQ